MSAVVFHVGGDATGDALWYLSALVFAGLAAPVLSRAASRGHQGRAWVLVAGIVTLLASTSPPVDAIADRSFSVHMVQHMLLVLLAAPLLVLGQATEQALMALPRATRRRLAPAVRFIAHSRRSLTGGLIATAAFAVIFWSWHVPGPFDFALEHPVGHVLEHATFVVSAYVFWAAILDERAAPQNVASLLFMTMIQTGTLGALLTLSNTVWYSSYTLQGPLGLDPVEDQQLAGLIMWIPANFFFFAVLAFEVYRWIKLDEARMALPRVGQPSEHLL